MKPPRLGTVFWWLWAGSLLSALAMFVAPFLAVYLSSQGLRPSAVGLVVSCYGVGALAAGPAAGALADALGRRHTLVFALVAAAAAAAVLAFVRAPLAMAAAVLLFGGGMAGSRPPMRAIVADVVPPGGLTRAFGWLYWAENLGASLSMLVGGLLATHGWTLPFLVDAVTTLGFALVVMARIPETRPAAAAPTGGRGGYGVVLHDRALRELLVLIFLVDVVYTQPMVAWPVDLARQGYGPATFGTIVSGCALLVVFLQPISARVLDPLGPARAMALGALLIALGVGGYALCRTPWQYGASSAVWTLGEIAFFATCGAAVAALAPAEARGRYMGAYGLCRSIAAVIAPTVGAAALEALGPRTLWLVCLGVGGFAAAGFLRARGIQGERSAFSPAPPPG